MTMKSKGASSDEDEKYPLDFESDVGARRRHVPEQP
jgi:hypothetical protein